MTLRLELTDAERVWHESMDGLARTDDGELTLAGLTVEESIWFVESSRAWLIRGVTGVRRTPDESERYLELADRHEHARMGNLATSHTLKQVLKG